MPSKLFTKQVSGSVGFKGKEYPIKDGVVEVPDEAVETLVESHGFSKTEIEDEGEPLAKTDEKPAKPESKKSDKK